MCVCVKTEQETMNVIRKKNSNKLTRRLILAKIIGEKDLSL